MNSSIRKTRDSLKNKAIGLRQSSLDASYDKTMEIREKQNEVYNKWKFYDNLIKATEKAKIEEMNKNAEK